MFVTLNRYLADLHVERVAASNWQADLAREGAANERLRSENAQLRATCNWMQLRLNATEKERAQLISAAIGVKIAIPEFVPAHGIDQIENALNEMQDLGTVGGDARDELPRTAASVEAPDYSMMPGYRKG